MAIGNTISVLSSQSEVQQLSRSEIYIAENSRKVSADIDALADSIREHGFAIPLTVRKKYCAAKFANYEIIDGKAR
jgi:ParB-like chromosome segregation protein Spo0J